MNQPKTSIYVVVCIIAFAAGTPSFAEDAPAAVIKLSNLIRPIMGTKDRQHANGTIQLSPRHDLQRIVADSPATVVLDFYADWCGPCKIQDANVERAAGSLARNQAQVVRIDVDKFPKLAEAFEVDALPTMVFVRHDKVVQRKTGVTTVEELATLTK